MFTKKLEICFVCLFFIIIGLSSSCGKKVSTYQEQFNLKRFKKLNFDLYNPFLNKFKIDTNERIKNPDFFNFDAYFDENSIVRYFFYRTDSYGYLNEVIYNREGELSRIKIYPILVDSIDKGADIMFNSYYYINGELKALKDELNGNIFVINGDYVFIYKGILAPYDKDFCIEKINPDEYYKKLLY
ncbi:MAG: hypothetical protein PVH61_44070 [Candidatus Aminicenantes bacterium]|jgi:hypothetical protein